MHAGGGEGRRQELFPRHGREGELLHRGNHGQGKGEFRKKKKSLVGLVNTAAEMAVHVLYVLHYTVGCCLQRGERERAGGNIQRKV